MTTLVSRQDVETSTLSYQETHSKKRTEEKKRTDTTSSLGTIGTRPKPESTNETSLSALPTEPEPEPEPEWGPPSWCRAHESQEPLLKPNPDRFAIHPITDRKLFDMYKKHQSAFWIPEEIDFSKDRDDWERLPKSAQFTLEHIFGYFAGADGIVNENLGTRILREVQSPEARCFYGFQFAMENIHGETYSLMLDTMIRDPTRKAELLRSIHADPIIARKGNWAQEWSKKGCFAECLLAFAVVEGTHFPGSFCSIFWLKRFNLMHGTTFSNELISKDEGLHTNFAAEMYRRLKRKLDEKHAHELVKGGINVEKAFIDYIYPEPFDCMNAKEVKEYVECITDRLLESLGYKKLYHTKNPYPWMDTIGMQGKTNFFEKRVGEYGKPGSVEALKKKISSVESEREPFSMDEDF